MENIFIEKIKNKKLTKIQQKIAEYFVSNHHVIFQKSLLQISKELNVSDVSVLRFVRSIGYEGYNDLKKDLYFHMENSMSNMSLTTRLGFNATSDSDEYPLEEYLESTTFNIEKSLKQNNQDSYNKVIELLEGSNKKYIIGFRGGKAPAIQFSRTLNLILDNVFGVVNDSPDVYIKLEALEENDFVILFSFVRYYNIDIDISEYVKSKGAKICVITDTATSPVAREADVVLLVDNRSISFFNSTAAVNSLSEYLLILLANKNRENIEKRLNRYDELTQKYRY